MKYLIRTVETYRVDTEEEAKQLIADAKADNHYLVTKSTTEFKEKKLKGEVVDTYFKVSLTKDIDDIKDPEGSVTIKYVELGEED